MDSQFCILAANAFFHFDATKLKHSETVDLIKFEKKNHFRSIFFCMLNFPSSMCIQNICCIAVY